MLDYICDEPPKYLSQPGTAEANLPKPNENSAWHSVPLADTSASSGIFVF